MQQMEIRMIRSEETLRMLARTAAQHALSKRYGPTATPPRLRESEEAAVDAAVDFLLAAARGPTIAGRSAAQVVRMDVKTGAPAPGEIVRLVG